MKDHQPHENPKATKQNFDDLQNEIGDHEVGKPKRFGVGESLEATKIQKKKDEERFALVTLMDLMNDPEYAKLYNETKAFVHNLMDITEEEIVRANKSLEELSQERKELLENTNKIEDGTIIFKNKNGEVLTENDEVITDPIVLESIVWKDGTTTYEEFAANREKIGSTLNEVDELTRYQVEKLGSAMVNYQDEDYRPDMEQMDQLKDNLVEGAPEAIKNRLDSDSVTHEISTAPHEVTAFKM